MTKFRLRSALIALLVTACFSLVCGQKPVLVVLNKADSTLAVVDPTTMKLLGKVPTGDAPHEVVISADGKTAFVANYGAQTPGSSLSVVDIGSIKELRRVDLSPLFRPHGLQMIGGKLYFTAEVNRLIARYDPAANKVDWVMGTGQNASHMIAGSSDQKRFYTANIASDTVTAFEFQNPPPSGSRIVQISVGKQPEAIALSPDGKEVWTGLNAEGAIDIVDTTTNKFKEKVNIGGRPYRVLFTPDGKFVVNSMVASKEILILDAATRKESKRIKLESVPMGIAFSNDGKTAFVSVLQPDLVLKVDLEKGEVLGSVAVGVGPDGIAVAGM
ncbi:MAG TPA: hypothetical protein VJL58_08395 [Pyrinomonadaceae bacterium]|nr:hypothetical protein [Pyrinomonadaceae bacterium]